MASDRDVVKLICERVMGWTTDRRPDNARYMLDFDFTGKLYCVVGAKVNGATRNWEPLTDRNDVAEMEASLRKLPQWPDYIKALLFLVAPDAEHAAANIWYLSIDDLAALATATARQRVEAAIKIMGDDDGK